jgi:hypothetical protein
LTSSVNPYASNSANVEYFWLCGRYSGFMALRLGQDGTVVAISLPDCAHRSREDFVVISRHKDKLLRSVTLARPTQRRD